MKIVSLSFADALFENSKKRYKAQLEATKIFDEIIFLCPDDLGPEFHAAHGEFLKTARRGYGFWIWKPYIIYEQLLKMDDGDILVYGDTGNSVTGFPKEFLMAILDVDQSGLIADQHNRLGAHCKKDVLRRMGVNPEEYRYRPVAEANRIVIKNTPIMRLAIKEWYEACCDYRNIDESESEEPNFPEFVFHRWDQSVFAVVFNKYEGELVDFGGIWDATRIRDVTCDPETQ
jgi:hypothetical protein